MEINIRHQVSPYLLFFIIVAAQVGVGFLGFHRIIARYAGYDAWISVLIAGVVIQLIVWIMFDLLSTAKGDIIEVHKQLYGPAFGSMMSSVILIYYWLAAVSVLREYIEIIQVWMFPTIPTWILSVIIIILCYYIIAGGFRVIAGICFVSCIFIFLFVSSLVHLPSMYIHFDNLLPVFDHSIADLLRSAKDTSFSMAGFEILLMVFPFIKNGKNSKKFAHFGAAATTLVYTISAITTFLFISENQLKHTIWARIYIIKLVRFSFLERFEYLLLSMYIIKVIAIIVLMLWASSRGFKLIIKTKQKYTLITLCILTIILCQVFDNRYVLNQFLDFIAKISLVLFYIYIPMLWLIFILFKKRADK